MARFSTEAARRLWTLPFEGEWPMAVAFAGNRRVVAGNRKGDLFLWELPDEADEAPATDPRGDKAKTDDERGVSLFPARQFVGHTNAISHVAVTADGKRLISASLDHTVRLWSLDATIEKQGEAVLDIRARQAEAKKKRSEEPLQRPGVPVRIQDKSQILVEHDDWVMSLSVSGDGQRILSGDAKAQVVVHEVESGNRVATWAGHPWNWIVSAALSPDGSKALVSEYCRKRGDFDHPAPALKLWDVNKQNEQADLLNTMFPKLNPASSTYSSASVWRKFVGGGLLGAAYSPVQPIVAVGKGGETDTGNVQFFDTDTGKLLRTSKTGHRYGITDIRFTSDGQHTISGGRDTTVRITRVEDGQEVAQLGKPRGGQFKDWTSSLALSPDNSLLAAADIGGSVHVWSLG